MGEYEGMTQHKAKEISLEVWRYFAAHPEIGRKSDLPSEIFQKIIDCVNKCPLCDLFYSDDGDNCPECPLRFCSDDVSLFGEWASGDEEERREIAANKIVDKIEAWEPEEE